MLTIKVTRQLYLEALGSLPPGRPENSIFQRARSSFAGYVTSVVQTYQLCNKGLASCSVNLHALKILHLTVSSGLGKVNLYINSYCHNLKSMLFDLPNCTYSK